MEEIKRFEVGQCYYTRAVGDHNLIYAYQVTKRTAKTVILQDEYGKNIGRRKITIFGGRETVSPVGNSSMSPMVGADDVLPGEGTLRERVNAIQTKERNENETEQRRLAKRQKMKEIIAMLRSGQEG